MSMNTNFGSYKLRLPGKWAASLKICPNNSISLHNCIHESVIAPSSNGIQNLPKFTGIMLLITAIFTDGCSIGITNLTQDQ